MAEQTFATSPWQIRAGSVAVTNVTTAATTAPAVGASIVTGVTIPGAKAGDVIYVSGPTVAQTGLLGVTAIVTAADTASFVFHTQAGFTGAAKTYNYELHEKS